MRTAPTQVLVSPSDAAISTTATDAAVSSTDTVVSTNAVVSTDAAVSTQAGVSPTDAQTTKALTDSITTQAPSPYTGTGKIFTILCCIFQ